MSTRSRRARLCIRRAAGHNARVKIDVHNERRERLFRVEVDAADPPSVVKPPSDGRANGDRETPAPGDATADGDQPREMYLDWDQAIDDLGHLRRCPVCGCRELFARKDFPQVTGFVIVVLAALVAMWLFVGARQVIAGLGVLAAVALIDAVVYLFAGRCLVCYRCRSEFRDTPIRKDHPGWELAIGEKYRDAPQETGVRGQETQE